MKILFTLILTLLLQNISSAQVFVKHDASGSNDGSSWQNAFTNLQDAIDSVLENEAIWISKGTYTPIGNAPENTQFLVTKPLKFYGGFIGNELELEERDWENNPTILSGDINGDDVNNNYNDFRLDNAHHLLWIKANDGTSTIDGLTIEGGTTKVGTPPNPIDPEEYHHWRGGGCYIQAKSIVRNCTFRQNTALAGAGAYFLSDGNESDELIIENCLFESNYAEQGAMRINGMNNPIVESCIFINNRSTNFGGGLILGNSNGKVKNCDFISNVATNVGGAVMIFQNTANLIESSKMSFENCRFISNDASLYGGGMYYTQTFKNSKIVLDSCQFNKNHSAGLGGAFYITSNNESPSDPLPNLSFNISNSEFTENTASNAGCGFAVAYASDTLNFNISNSIISNNEATDQTGNYGGIALGSLQNGFIKTKIENVQFENNKANGCGGAICFSNNNNDRRLEYEISECLFKNNEANICAGAIWSTIASANSLGAIGKITNTDFIANAGFGTSGAIASLGENLEIDNCLFSENVTIGNTQGLEGGGATFFRFPKDIRITNTRYSNNVSQSNGGAIMVQEGDKVVLENVILDNNEGISTIYNEDSMWLRNVTLINNLSGIDQKDNAYLEIQNSIIDNENDNFTTAENTVNVSKGGNICTDGSMSGILIGFDEFSDFNDTDPSLDMDFVPLNDSPCIDAGNPMGIENDYDLLGNERIQGSNIDIGAIESPFTTSIKNKFQNEIDINVFPNPTTALIYFKAPDGLKQIKLYNTLGHFIKSVSKQGVVYLPTHLNPGQYYLEFDFGHLGKEIISFNKQ